MPLKPELSPDPAPRRVKLLHVIRSADPVSGGPIEGIRQLGAAQVAAGSEVEVVCLDAPGAAWMADFPFPLHALGPSWLGYGYTPRLVPWLRAHAAEYDVVIVNGLWQFNSFAVWRVLRRAATPYVVFTHGMLDPWFRHRYPLKHLKKWLYWPWAEYRALRDADAVLFTCEEERRQARKSFWLYRCREVVVNYGTAGPVGDAARQRALFREKFPALAGRRLLLFLGRIHVKKGCDLLLENFARLRAERPGETEELRLVMAGPGGNRFADELQTRATALGLGERVCWTGMLGGDLKWGAFHAAEVFLLPSHQENFGISVAEALACGVPVLISDKVNIWREIAEDGAGLVAPDDLAGTGELLRRWLALDAAEQAAMRAMARACFARRFEIAAAARSLSEVLGGLVAAARG